MSLSPFNQYIMQTIQHGVPMRQSYEHWIAVNGKGIVGFAEKMGWMRDTQELMALLIDNRAKEYLTGLHFPVQCPHCHKTVLEADQVGTNLTELFMCMGGQIAQDEWNRLQQQKAWGQRVPAPTPPPQTVASVYNCPTCQGRVGYGQRKCWSCGQELEW